MAEISKITLPSGNTYDLKDAVARQMISNLGNRIIAWNGQEAPVVANIPSGVSVVYNNVTYTGTLSPNASTVQPKSTYLVMNSGIPTSDNYAEYGVIGDEGSRTWELLGNLTVDLSGLGDLAYKDNVVLNKGTGDKVLGEATTFTNGASAVSFSGGTSDTVLGADTTFTVSVPTYSASKTNIKATASGTAVGADGTANAVTGYTPTTDTFVKSVTAETNKKLVTTSITPTNGTESVSKVTKTASKLVTDSVPNVTSVGSASTWTFAMGTGTNAETLIISGVNSVAPTLGTAKTVATGAVSSSGTGSDIITGVTISDKTVAKAGSAITVATGATDENGSGDSIVTGVTVGDSASAITGLGTPSTSTVLTGVKVTTQPTVNLSTGATAGTGVISVATDVNSAANTNNVTVGGNDEVTAVTNIGTGTAAAQTITVGTNDKVTVAKHSDLSITVS